MFNSKIASRWTLAAFAVAASVAAPMAGAASLTEGFSATTAAAPLPAGWTAINNSDVPVSEGAPTTTSSWIKGATSPFPAQVTTPSSPSNSYISSSFNATGGDVISNWLILPTLAFDNGDVFSFFTRTPTLSQFPDRLEVRFSSVGGTNVGNSPTSVGDFSTLLLSINPNQLMSTYPEAWTQFSATITGLSGTTNGAIAFRYYVTDVANFTNGNFIGIDTVSITAVPEPATYLVMGAGLALIGLRRLKASQA